MIEYLSEKFTESLIKHHYIHDLQKADYIYATTVFIEKWISILAIMLLSICFDMVISTMFFLFFLIAVKKRCCGFHANSFKTCFFLTLTIYIVFILFLMPIMMKELTITYILFGISIIILELIGAVNHPNVNWNHDEYNESKKASRICVAMEGFTIVFLIFLDASNEIIVSMMFAIILNAFFLLIAKINKQEGFYEQGTCKNKNATNDEKDY